MQHSPTRRLPEPLGLRPLSLSTTVVRRDRELRSHQAPLLHDARSDQSDADRAERAARRLDGRHAPRVTVAIRSARADEREAIAALTRLAYAEIERVMEP